MSDTPTHRDDHDADDRDDLPSDPDAPGTYVDDDTATEVPEPNEPG